MNRIRRMVYAAYLCVLLGMTSSLCADGGETPACALGSELRKAVGFGPCVLATLGVDAENHAAIATLATTYCNQHRETVEPLIEAVTNARANAFRQYETNGDVESADQAVINAANALAASCSSVVTSMHNELSARQKTLRARFAANPLLDVNLGLLDLTEAQRNTLRTAQRTRDLIHKHHKNRKNLNHVRQAQEIFETSVAEVLTTEQGTLSATLLSTMQQNIGDITDREKTLCGE